jgi:hypothetical protein
VHGQYQGHADVPGVAPGSTTETYVALRLEIDNWRWSWGPEDAETLVRGHPRWQDPWLPAGS